MSPHVGADTRFTDLYCVCAAVLGLALAVLALF